MKIPIQINLFKRNVDLPLLKKVATFFAATVLLIGVVELFGWGYDILLFLQPNHGILSMNPATAIGFVLCSTTFLLIQKGKKTNTLRRVVYFLSLLIIMIGFACLLTDFKIYDITIGNLQIAYTTMGTSFNNGPNIMTPIAALHFIGIGFCLFLLYYKKTALIQYVSLMIACSTLLAIIGYIYGVTEFYGFFSYFPMAVHTAVCSLLLSLGFLFVSSDRGFMGEITSAYGGGKLARIQLPLVILLPVILGIARLYGERKGLYGTVFGVTLFTIGNIIIFIVLIWKSAAATNQADFLLNKEMANGKKIHYQLQHLMNSMQKLLNLSDDILCVVDKNGRYVGVSDNCYKIWGYSADNIMGKQFIELVHDDDRLKASEAARDIVLGGKIIDFENRQWKKDGSYVNVIWTAIWSKDDERIYCIGRDCTDRLKTEKEMKEYHQRIAIIHESITDGFMAVNKEGQLIYSNKEAERILNMQKEVTIGKNIWEINIFGYQDANYQQNKFYIECQRAIIEEVSVHFETYVQVLNRWFDVNVYPSKDGLSVYFKDITLRLNSIKAIEEQNKKLREIAWIQSHEVRAPLTSIKGLINLLNDPLTGEADKKDILQFLAVSANELDDVITQIVSKTKIIEIEMRQEEIEEGFPVHD